MSSNRQLPEGIMKLTFHTDAPGYGPEHFDRLMTIDKVTVAMYGCLYDELDSEEEQDLVIAHCLGLDPPKPPPKPAVGRRYNRFVPKSMRFQG